MRPPKGDVPVDEAPDEEDEVATYAAFADIVKGRVKLTPERYAGDVDYVVKAALAAGCTTRVEFESWLARQHTLGKRSGFKSPDARHFPEPDLVPLVKYLRFAEKARDS